MNDCSDLKCIILSHQFFVICKLSGAALSSFCRIIDKDSRRKCKDSPLRFWRFPAFSQSMNR